MPTSAVWSNISIVPMSPLLRPRPAPRGPEQAGEPQQPRAREDQTDPEGLGFVPQDQAMLPARDGDPAHGIIRLPDRRLPAVERRAPSRGERLGHDDQP